MKHVNARLACEALQLRPDYLADLFSREVAYQLRQLAEAAEGPMGPELGGFSLQFISNLLQLIAALEGEWDRQHPDEPDEPEHFSAKRQQFLRREGEGDGAKEATSAAAAPPHEGSR